MKFNIYIPTRSRAKDQITLGFLCDRNVDLNTNICLVVDECQYEEYYRRWGKHHKVIAMPKSRGSGIHNARQFCLDYHIRFFPEIPYAIMIDDDMVFFRREFASIRLTECLAQDMYEMFSEIETSLERFPMVGVSARQGNNNVKEDYQIATRQMNFHAVNPYVLKNLGIRFDEFEVMEDFNVVLSLLQAGIANKVLYEYCWNQKGSGAKGGCSDYRDYTVQSNAAFRLAEKFPKYVTVVDKKSKSGWDGMQTRKDVRIQWKKAYNDGKELK